MSKLALFQRTISQVLFDCSYFNALSGVMVNFVSEDVEVNENNGSVFVCVERNTVTDVEQTVPIIISVGTADSK